MDTKDTSEKALKLLRVITCSGQRMRLLLVLNEGGKTVGDLRDAVQLDSPAIVHALRVLEANRLVSESGRTYYLTAIGKNVAHKVIDFCGAVEVIFAHEQFWTGHDVSGIPEQLFDRIAALRDYTLLVDTPLDLRKAYYSFVELLKGSHTLRIVSSVYAPDPLFLYDEYVARHKHLELVTTESVAHQAIESLGKARVRRALREGHKLYVVRQDPKLVFAVADHLIAFMLYRFDGILDYSTVLTSRSEEALAWGHDVFRHYVQLAECVTL
jgi:predicted transcriptional regulator